MKELRNMTGAESSDADKKSLRQSKKRIGNICGSNLKCCPKQIYKSIFQ